MLIYKIIGIGITGAILSLIVKQHRPDFAIAIPILVAVVVIGVCAPYIETVLNMFENIADSAGIEISQVRIVIKIIGVAYICQFASDICKDVGESSISSKIELGGKLIIITLSMPIVYNLLELVSRIINF